MGIVVANLADKNKQLDRDLNEQIIQNQMIQDQFNDLTIVF